MANLARALGLIAALGLIVGCSSTGGNGSPGPTSEGSSPAATTSAASSSPAAPTPSDEPTRIDGILVARLVVYPDVSVAPVPADLAVYADGTVLTQGWRSSGFDDVRYVVRRLTPAGLTLVRAAFDRVVTRGGTIGAIPSTSPATGGGYTTYVVTVGREDGLVTASTTNASVGAGVKALVDFGERWPTPEQLLPSDAWAVSTPVAFVPERWSLTVTISPSCCATSGRPEDSVLTPFVGPLDAFGQAVDRGDLVGRCGAIDRRTLDAIRGALSATVADLGGGLGWLEVMLNHGVGMTSLTVVPLAPDEAVCTP